MTHVDSSKGLPITTAQLEFWQAAEEIEPPSSNSYAAEYIEIHGSINPKLFEKALHQLINDSETLRVRFIRTVNGSPEQLIRENSDGWSLPYFDLSNEKNPESVALAWMEEKFTRKTDLSVWPLFIFALFKISNEQFFWLQGYPHIIVDGFALMLLAKRVAVIYSAHCREAQPEAHRFLPLSKLVEEDVKYRLSEQFKVDQNYWLDLFSDGPKSTTLAGEPLLSSRGNLSDRRVTQYLTSMETIALYHAAKQDTKTTLAQFITAMMAAYIHLMTGVSDVVLSVVAMSRIASSERRAPGMCANMLPFRMRVGPNMSIYTISQQAADGIGQLKKHQRYRGGDLGEELVSLKNRQGVFGTEINVMCFNYNVPFAGFNSTTHNVAAGTTDDLMINVSDRRDGLGLRVDLDASPEYYTQEGVKYHLDNFIGLLLLAAANPSMPISRLKHNKDSTFSKTSA